MSTTFNRSCKKRCPPAQPKTLPTLGYRNFLPRRPTASSPTGVPRTALRTSLAVSVHTNTQYILVPTGCPTESAPHFYGPLGHDGDPRWMFFRWGSVPREQALPQPPPLPFDCPFVKQNLLLPPLISPSSSSSTTAIKVPLTQGTSERGDCGLAARVPFSHLLFCFSRSDLFFPLLIP